MAQVILDERADEEIAVVIAGLHAQRQRMTRRLRCGDQRLRLQLRLQEAVAVTLVDQDRQTLLRLADQRAGVPVQPAVLVRSQIAAERLLAPGNRRRVDDGGEGRHRLVEAGMLQRADQRAMPAHRMAGDGTAAADREIPFDQRRQFPRHIIVHAVMPRPRLLRRIDVEARALPEIPGAVGIARHPFAARAGIGGDDGKAQLSRDAEGAGLLGEVLVGAGQAGQPIEDRHLGAVLHLRRQEDGEGHFAAHRRGLVPHPLQPAAEDAGFRQGGEGVGHGTALFKVAVAKRSPPPLRERGTPSS